MGTPRVRLKFGAKESLEAARDHWDWTRGLILKQPDGHLALNRRKKKRGRVVWYACSENTGPKFVFHFALGRFRIPIMRLTARIVREAARLGGRCAAMTSRPGLDAIKIAVHCPYGLFAAG